MEGMMRTTTTRRLVSFVLLGAATAAQLSSIAGATTNNNKNDANRLRVVSLVLEPFEAAHDVEVISSPLDDLQYYGPNGNQLSPSLSNNVSFVGNASLQMKYHYHNEGSGYYAIRGFAGYGGREAIYAATGAHSVSFAYKVSSPFDANKGLRWRFSLYDDTSCAYDDDTTTTNCTDLDQLQGWQYESDILLEADDWQEMEFPLDMSYWKPIINTTSTGNKNGDGNLDLSRLKAWQLEFFPPNSTKTSSDNEDEPSFLYLDHLRLIGDGSLLSGGLVEVANYPLERIEHLQENMKESRHPNSLWINYTIEMYAVWGGDMTYTYVCPSRAYYNLSEAKAITYDYYTVETADPVERSSLRFRVLDASDCLQDCGRNPTEVENYYAFHSVMRQPSGTRGQIEMSLNTTAIDADLELTGWYGVLGNELFDKDLIKGYMFQFQINRNGDIGSRLTGQVEIGNLTAWSIYPSEDVDEQGGAISAGDEIDPNGLVSLVLEPFEAAHDESPLTTPLIDLQYYSPNGNPLDLSLSNDSFVGNTSLLLEYDGGQQNGDDSGGYTIKGFAGFARVYAALGAQTVSFAYKTSPGAEGIRWTFSLYDDSACVNTTNCTDLENLQGWQYESDTLLQTDDNWQEVEFPLDMTQWNPITTTSTTSTAGNGILDLNRLKAWQLEFFPLDSTNTESSPALYLDHLRLIGDGSLFGSGFPEVAQYPFNPELHPIENMKESRHRNSLWINYTIEMYAVWGGDVVYAYVCPSRAYYNMSEARAVAFDYYTIKTADPADRSSLRFRVLDASDCIQECDVDPTEMENSYSFHPVLKQPSGTRGEIEMSLNTTATDADLELTGWYGILGNEVFDKDLIKGYKFQFQINRNGDIGSRLTGEIEIGNLTALPPHAKTEGIEDEEGKPVCRIEPGIEIATDETQFDFLQIVGQVYHDDCCAACMSNPDCNFGLSSSYRKCLLLNYLPPNQLQITNQRYDDNRLQFFWKDTLEARGSYCEKCHCSPSERLIDCRGQNLTLIPMFTNATWQPLILDLRDNPRLTFLGAEEESVFHNLVELRLPRDLIYLSENLLNKMGHIDAITFEDEADNMTSAAKGDEAQSRFINAIQHTNQAFSDICCGLGNDVIVPSLLPSQKLTYCHLREDTPGVDAIYEEFISYEFGRAISTITPRALFMSEAADSAETCAEYCHIRNECYYFSFDARPSRAEKVCRLLKTKGTSKYVCCEDKDYEDPDLGTPGFVSGRVPKTRHLEDGAKVLVEPQKTTLEAHQNNQYTAQFYVSLGDMPLRGAVWVEPRLAKSTLPEDAMISFSTSKVILYDNQTIVPVEVTIENAFVLEYGGSIAIINSIEACDQAFVVSTTCSLGDELTVSIKVTLPPPLLLSTGSGNDLVVPLAVGMAVLLLLVGVIGFFFVQQKRKQADTLWMIKEEDLIFKEPREVLGRGTFGYVLLAEYRGTQVAVKRVIPPKADVEKAKARASFAGRSRNRPESWSNEDLEAASPPLRPNKPGTMTVALNMDSSARVRARSRGTKSGQAGSLNKESSVASRVGTGSIGSSWGITKTMNNLGQEDYATLKKNFIEEMRHLSKLRHPCVTTVMGAVVSKQSEPMLIMEYMEHGSLYDLLHNDTVAIDGENILPILRDLTNGVRFLHAASPQVLHGDLKAQNILVDSRFRAKVADFGLTQKKKLGTIGTPYWMAPEQLRGESSNTAKSDVYSFGIILYEVYSRKDPYEDEVFEEVIERIVDAIVQKRPPIPESCPEEIKTIYRKCISEFPGDRPTFEELDNQMKTLTVAKVEPARPSLQRRASFVSRSSRSARTENLLHEVFPPHIAKQLHEGKKVEPEHHSAVTIFFSDIVGFTKLSSVLTPVKVSEMLDRLYLRFDELSHKHEVFKVETIGDSWMGVTNLVQDQPNHAERIALFALDAVEAAQETEIDPDDPSLGRAQIRVGFHSGPVVASVVGSRNPRYCLFGDTVNTASRMESNSVAGKIQCSEATRKHLPRKDQPGIGIRLINRGKMEIKGKGQMTTYFVERSSRKAEERQSQSTMASIMASSEFLDERKSATEPPREAPLVQSMESLLGDDPEEETEVDDGDKFGSTSLLP